MSDPRVEAAAKELGRLAMPYSSDSALHEAAEEILAAADAVGDRPCTCDGTESVAAVCAEQSPVGRWVCSHCKRPMSGSDAVQSPGQGADRNSKTGETKDEEIARLRSLVARYRRPLVDGGRTQAERLATAKRRMDDAEAEVTRLRARCDELTEALRKIVKGDVSGVPGDLLWEWERVIARRALDEYGDPDSSEVQARADAHDRVAGGVAEAAEGDPGPAGDPA